MNDYTYEYQECFIEVEGVERRLNVVKFNVRTLPTSVKDGCLLYQVYYIHYILYAIHWKLIHVPIVWSWNAIIAIHTPVNNHILLINISLYVQCSFFVFQNMYCLLCILHFFTSKQKCTNLSRIRSWTCHQQYYIIFY